jgi:hypothetical protein
MHQRMPTQNMGIIMGILTKTKNKGRSIEAIRMDTIKPIGNQSKTNINTTSKHQFIINETIDQS